MAGLAEPHVGKIHVDFVCESCHLEGKAEFKTEDLASKEQAMDLGDNSEVVEATFECPNCHHFIFLPVKRSLISIPRFRRGI